MRPWPFDRQLLIAQGVDITKAQEIALRVDGDVIEIDRDDPRYRELRGLPPLVKREKRPKADPVANFNARKHGIPDDFDPEAEKQRMRQGGCCGPPSNE